MHVWVLRLCVEVFTLYFIVSRVVLFRVRLFWITLWLVDSNSLFVVLRFLG